MKPITEHLGPAVESLARRAQSAADKYDKESVYDTEIAPLMKQIIEICKREELPMVAQFYLKQQHPDANEENGPMYCTTTIIPSREKIYEKHHAHLTYVAEAMKYGPGGKPYVAAYTIKSNY